MTGSRGRKCQRNLVGGAVGGLGCVRNSELGTEEDPRKCRVLLSGNLMSDRHE